MYEKFTDRARKVMELCNDEARRFKHEYIGTEHILLGLIAEGTGVAANVLKNLRIDLRKVRLEVEKIVQAGPDAVTMSRLPMTPRAKRVIEFAIEESHALGHTYVGTEHLLLGLMREYQGLASQILMNLGLNLETLREEILNLLGPNDMSANVRLGTTAEKTVVTPDAEIRGLSETNQAIVVQFDILIEMIRREKEHAIAGVDFDKASDMRDLQNRLHKYRTSFIHKCRKN